MWLFSARLASVTLVWWVTLLNVADKVADVLWLLLKLLTLMLNCPVTITLCWCCPLLDTQASRAGNKSRSFVCSIHVVFYSMFRNSEKCGLEQTTDVLKFSLNCNYCSNTWSWFLLFFLFMFITTTLEIVLKHQLLLLHWDLHLLDVVHDF